MMTFAAIATLAAAAVYYLWPSRLPAANLAALHVPQPTATPTPAIDPATSSPHELLEAFLVIREHCLARGMADEEIQKALAPHLPLLIA